MANARNTTTRHADSDAERRSQLAKQMRTAPSREERSKAARELSNSRSAHSKSEAGRKGGSASRKH